MIIETSSIRNDGSLTNSFCLLALKNNFPAQHDKIFWPSAGLYWSCGPLASWMAGPLDFWYLDIWALGLQNYLVQCMQRKPEILILQLVLLIILRYLSITENPSQYGNFLIKPSYASNIIPPPCTCNAIWAEECENQRYFSIVYIPTTTYY